MCKYYTTVVLYNSLVESSETLSRLQKIKNHNIDILIFDNSDNIEIMTKNEATAKSNNWIYLSEGKNLGLSKAYNKVLEYLKNKEGIVIWLDDDTSITQEYFDILHHSLSDDYDIYVPVIRAQNGKFYSPNEEGFFKNKQLKSPNGVINQRKFNAINSCTAVKLDVYNSYRYDEDLFLDQIDHDFFRSQRLLGKHFLKLPVIITHNLSLKNVSGDIDTIKKRFRLLIPDYIIYVRKKGRLASKLAYLKVLGWGVQQSIKNRNWNFVWWVIKEFIF